MQRWRRLHRSSGESSPFMTSAARSSPPVEAKFYDKSNEFFKLWLDPSMTRCALLRTSRYEVGRGAVREAQAGIGQAPGMTLPDIGCGWGLHHDTRSPVRRQRVIGLALSETSTPTTRRCSMRLISPRQCANPGLGGVRRAGRPHVPRCASEHSSPTAPGTPGSERYDTFFQEANLMPRRLGRMLPHHHYPDKEGSPGALLTFR